MQVFLAAPLAGFFGPLATSTADDANALAETLTTLEGMLAGAGHSVFIAHRRENFGQSMWPAEACTPFDFLEMIHCDAVVALPFESFGVHVELGWASALRKPTLVILEDGNRPATPLLHGLSTVSRCKTLVAPRGFRKDRTLLREVGDHVLREMATVLPSPPVHAFAVLSDDRAADSSLAAVSVAASLRQLAPELEVHYFGREPLHTEAYHRVFEVDLGREYVVAELNRHLEVYRAVFLVACSLDASSLRYSGPVHVASRHHDKVRPADPAASAVVSLDRAAELVDFYRLRASRT